MQWRRPSVCKVPRLGATFVFSVIFAGCELIGVCFPSKCDFREFYGFAKGGCCGSRDCCARRLTRMSVGLTLNGGGCNPRLKLLEFQSLDILHNPINILQHPREEVTLVMPALINRLLTLDLNLNRTGGRTRGFGAIRWTIGKTSDREVVVRCVVVQFCSN
jgi:hypothetical protein